MHNCTPEQCAQDCIHHHSAAHSPQGRCIHSSQSKQLQTRKKLCRYCTGTENAHFSCADPSLGLSQNVIDMSCAFDTVNREKILDALTLAGCVQIIIKNNGVSAYTLNSMACTWASLHLNGAACTPMAVVLVLTVCNLHALVVIFFNHWAHLLPGTCGGVYLCGPGPTATCTGGLFLWPSSADTLLAHMMVAVILQLALCGGGDGGM